MASIRELKKDIDYIIFELISDSLAFGELHSEDKSDDISGIVSEAVSLRNELISRINKRERSSDPKALKAYLQKINMDLFAGTDELFVKLSSLAEKK